jgi:uncharacterized repeat protein (TIGR03803 family)
MRQVSYGTLLATRNLFLSFHALTTPLARNAGSGHTASSSGSNRKLGSRPSVPAFPGSDGDLYGTTAGGGVYDGGTVFKITPGGTLTTLYNFCPQGYPCTDGISPQASLVQGRDGNFYGTTQGGGTSVYYGTVFKITPQGTLTTLHSFAGYPTDGAGPTAGLVQGTDGNFYGTTFSGGASGTCVRGCGTVFKISSRGTLTTLHSFDYTDGAFPEAGALVQEMRGQAGMTPIPTVG